MLLKTTANMPMWTGCRVKESNERSRVSLMSLWPHSAVPVLSAANYICWCISNYWFSSWSDYENLLGERKNGKRWKEGEGRQGKQTGRSNDDFRNTGFLLYSFISQKERLMLEKRAMEHLIYRESHCLTLHQQLSFLSIWQWPVIPEFSHNWN